MLWGIGIYEASFQTSGANEHDAFSTEVHVIVHFHQEFGQNVVGAPFQKPQALHGVPLITFLNIQKYLTKKPLQESQAQTPRFPIYRRFIFRAASWHQLPEKPVH